MSDEWLDELVENGRLSEELVTTVRSFATEGAAEATMPKLVLAVDSDRLADTSIQGYDLQAHFSEATPQPTGLPLYMEIEPTLEELRAICEHPAVVGVQLSGSYQLYESDPDVAQPEKGEEE